MLKAFAKTIQVYINTANVDIFLILETHFTSHSFCEI